MYRFSSLEKVPRHVSSLEGRPSFLKQVSSMNLAEKSKQFHAISDITLLTTQSVLIDQVSPMNLAEKAKKFKAISDTSLFKTLSSPITTVSLINQTGNSKKNSGVQELDWLQATLGLEPGPVEPPPSPDVPPKDPSPTAVHTTSQLELNDPKLSIFHSLTRLSSMRIWHNAVRAMRRDSSSLILLPLQYNTSTSSMGSSESSIGDISNKVSSPVLCLQQQVGNPLPPTPVEYAYDWLEMPEDQHNASESVIGFGAFSSVVHVKSDKLDLIIKVFKRDIVSDYQITQEADTAAYLSSLGVGPNITGLFFPCDKFPLPALGMPYLEGSCDLYTLLQRMGLTKFDVFDLLRQAARLIVVIHSQGILHNDIKPSNMLAAINPTYHGKSHIGMAPPRGVTGGLTKESRFRLYLIDFGHTTYLDGARFRFDHMSHEEKEKFAHLAPEVIEGAETTIYSDVYSFGKLLDVSVMLLEREDIGEKLALLINSCTVIIPEERPNMELVERDLSFMVPKASSNQKLNDNERLTRWAKANASAETLWGNPPATRSLSDISDSEDEEELQTVDLVQNPIQKPVSLSEKNLASVLGLQRNCTFKRYSGPLTRQLSLGESRIESTVDMPWYTGLLNKDEISTIEACNPTFSKEAGTSKEVHPLKNSEEDIGLAAFCRKMGSIDAKSPQKYASIRDLIEADNEKMPSKGSDEIEENVGTSKSSDETYNADTYSDDGFEADDESDSDDNF